MILSHFVEKLKIGKKFVLLDLIVHPDCQRPWETAGPENKYIPVEVWKLIYKKLESLCRRQFPERSKSDGSTKCELDREYEWKVEGRGLYLMKYEFKDKNAQTMLNMVFNDDFERLHSECLVVQILDHTKELLRELQEKTKTIEKQQKEIDRLREMPPENSQEYTPAPVVVKKSSSSSSSTSLEYIPTVINGGSPVVTSSYKARKIEGSVKKELDPYTPISSQESNPENISYIPRGLKTPSKADSKVSVPSSGDSVIAGKRRRREKDIFGSEDEEELGMLSTPGKVKEETRHNRSDEDMFSSPQVNEASEESSVLKDLKRMQLPRKSKITVSYGELMSSEGDSGSTSTTSTPSVTKRRRKEDESASKCKSSTKGNLDGWLEKPSRKKDDAKDKENQKRHKGGKKEEEEQPAAAVVPLRVDHDKLREEAEMMRKTIENCDKLDQMFPEDKTLLNVPILNLHNMLISEIKDTFEDYRDDLQCIYDQYKNRPRKGLLKTDLCDFTEVTGVLTDDQTYAMMQHLEVFNTEEERGMYTEFFAATLIMEWGIRIWMHEFGYDDRQKALERIKLQEEANPMDLTPTTLQSMMGSCSKKR